MISVVMSNYNGARHIEEAMRSVLKQDFDDYEFIVVDDGSTDGSGEIISRVAQERPERLRLFLEKENRGQAAGFNIGITAAKGEIVCLMDSDDLWFREKLRRVHEFFSAHGDAVLHQHNLNLILDGKLSDERYHKVIVVGDYLGEVQKNGRVPLFVPTSGLSIRRDVLMKVLPIPETFRVCADGYVTRTCFCYGEVGGTSDCWGAYRVHEGNSVFQNREFETRHYVRDLLFPALNAYYKEHGIALYFPWPPGSAAMTGPRGAWKRLFLSLLPPPAAGMFRWFGHLRNVASDAGKGVLRKLLPERVYAKVYEALRRKN